MFAKPTTLFALLAVATRVLATPPACLIAAVNTQANPAAISAVCSGNNATAVESYICKNCTADTVQLAMSGFASVCAGAGVTISTSSVTSTGAILATGSSGAILTGGASSGFATATANGTVSSAHSAPTATQSSNGGSGSGTSGSGSAASGTSSGSSASASAKPYTGAAARLGMDLVGLAALGAFGAMLAL
ncbi:hypothetical protein LTR86_010735 [Recurvomyces mirabilis]|nr:hypothetical protein LTR86_010735 [Recurvomyces mirabilis]